MPNLLSINDLSRSDIETILCNAAKKEYYLETSMHLPVQSTYESTILASVFYEPSTRTRLSFESAMLRMGGKIVSCPDMKYSKTESLEDTGQVISSYADIIVVRHPETGSVAKFAQHCPVPVINGGDGPNEHPTQTLLDLYTIQKFKTKIDGLTVGIANDLKFGRTVHSLVRALLKFEKITFYFVAHPDLQIQREIQDILDQNKIEYHLKDSLSECIDKLDVIYMTRIQEERFSEEKYYDNIVLTPEVLSKAKSDAIVLHPLPRAGEIDPECDKDPRAKYFDQVKSGLYTRMAVLDYCLGPL